MYGVAEWQLVGVWFALLESVHSVYGVQVKLSAHSL